MASPITYSAYPSDHWSQWSATSDALERYVGLNREPYNATKFELLCRLVGPLRGLRVLDYGGGAGYFAVWCATQGADVTLVDPEAPALKLAERYADRHGVRSRLQAIRDNGLPLQLAGRLFELVVLKDVIEHIVDDRALLRALGSQQRSGDRLLLSTHNSWSLNFLVEDTYRRRWCGERDWLGWDPTHVRFYDPRSLQVLLGDSGYRVRRWASMYIVPYDILSWLTALRRRVVLPSLRHVDCRLGTTWPFSRLGWNVLVLAERV